MILKKKEENNIKRNDNLREDEVLYNIGEVFNLKNINPKKDRKKRNAKGKNVTSISNNKKGRYFKSVSYNLNNNSDIAVDATIRAAAVNQKIRKEVLNKEDVINLNKENLIIKSEDYRYKLREKKIGNIIVFAVDSSGSMQAQKRMEAVKGTIMSFLKNSYEKRDRVALISIKGEKSKVLLPPTNSVILASNLLKNMKTGGGTPLSHGIYQSLKLIETEKTKDKDIKGTILLISDCKANVSMKGNQPYEEAKNMAKLIEENNIDSIFVDVEKEDIFSLGLAKEICEIANGQYFKINDLKKDKLLNLINTQIGGITNEKSKHTFY